MSNFQAGQPDDDRHAIMEWLRALPGSYTRWLLEVRTAGRVALFANSRDSEVPYTIHASAVGTQLLGQGTLRSLDPGLHAAGLAEDVQTIRGCQEARTGLFVDPYLDARLPGRDRPEILIPFRHAVSKYAIVFLRATGTAPLYPYTTVGETGQPDASAYLAYMRGADWREPWGTGSHAGAKSLELFRLLNEGNEQYARPLEQGIRMILSHQDPRTGVWGDDDLPLHVRMSGALKVNGRLFWGMGVDIPNMDRLADTLLAGWAGGELGPGQGVLIPRNVGELAAMCLEHSPYRTQELQDLLSRVLGCLRGFQGTDGGFSGSRDGCAPLSWCGSPICGRAREPRSDMVGMQSVHYTVALLAPYVGWEDCPWPSPFQGWRQRLAALRFRVQVDASSSLTRVSLREAEGRATTTS